MTTPTTAPDRAQAPAGPDYGKDPRHVFLTREDIYRRHGYGRARGYEHLADLVANDAAFPLQLGGGWRLDHILAWEDHHALAGLRAFATASVVADAAALAPRPEESAKRKPGRPKRLAA